MTEVATQRPSWITNGLRNAVASLAARDPDRDGWWSALARRLAIDTSDAYYRTVLQRALHAGRDLTLDPAAFDSPTIVLACGSLAPGGTERQVVTTARALSERHGLQVTIVCMFLSPPPLDFYRPLLNDSSVSVSELPPIGPCDDAATHGNERALGELATGLPRELRDVVRYVNLFRACRPSIVHTWLDEINVKAGIAALIAGVPRIVLSARSVAPTHFRLFQPYMRQAYRLLLEHPRVTLLNNSTAGARDYAQWLQWPALAIRVVRNGVDVSAAQRVQVDPARRRLRDRLGIAPDCHVVGTVIRLSEEKRPLLWVESAAALAASHPSCHFVIVGDGDLASTARTLAETLGIAPRCHFLGHQRDSLEWIGGFDVFLLTSRKEGLPNVLLEAQALGVPVVCADAGGACEALIPGTTGWIVEPADADHIAAALRRVLDQPRWRAAVRGDGPAFVASQFGLDRMIAETLDVYGHRASMTRHDDPRTH